MEKMVPHLLIFPCTFTRVGSIVPARVGRYLNYIVMCRKYSCKGRYFPAHVGNIPAKVGIFLHV